MLLSSVSAIKARAAAIWIGSMSTPTTCPLPACSAALECPSRHIQHRHTASPAPRRSDRALFRPRAPRHAPVGGAGRALLRRYSKDRYQLGLSLSTPILVVVWER